MLHLYHFPPVIDISYKTKRYSYLAFQNWLKEFIKEKTVKPKDKP
jgi:hypothetical protein